MTEREHVAGAARSAAWLAVGWCVVWFGVTRLWWAPVYGGADPNGYLLGARELLRTGAPCQRPRDPDTGARDPFAFVGTMWVGVDLGGPDERYYPKYPLGAICFYAVAMWLGGAAHALTAAYLLNPVAMAVGLLGTFFLARCVLSPWLALAATVVTGASPAVLMLANDPRSHGLSLALVTWGLVALLRWWRSPTVWWAVAAGACLGLAVTVRYSSGIFLVPAVAVFLTGRAEGRGRRSRSASACSFVAAWGLPVGSLALANHHMMGMLTAYDATNESTAFAWSSLLGKAPGALGVLFTYGLFLAVPLAILGLALAWLETPRLGLVLTAAILPDWLVNASYYWRAAGRPYNDVRLYLELLPVLAVAALLVLERRDTPSFAGGAVRRAGAALLCLAALVHAAVTFVPAARYLVANQRDLTRRLEIVRRNVPAGALILGSDAGLLSDLQVRAPYRLLGLDAFDEGLQRSIAGSRAPGVWDRGRAEYLLSITVRRGRSMVAARDAIIRDALSRGRPVFVVTSRPGDRALLAGVPLTEVAADAASRRSPDNEAVGPKPPADWKLWLAGRPGQGGASDRTPSGLAAAADEI